RPQTNSAGRASRTPPLTRSSAAANLGDASFSCPRLAANRSSVAVAPRPIGAAQSASTRWLLLLAAGPQSASAASPVTPAAAGAIASKAFFLVAREPVLPGSLSATCSASPAALRQPSPP